MFCAGEKSGLFVGHTEAMATGALAVAEYFERMQERRLYTLDIDEIKRKVAKLNLTDIFKEKLI